MIKRKIMITLAATVAAMTLVTGCGKKTTSMTEISREDLVQVTKDSDENETSGDKALPTTTKETEKSTKESASEETEAETSSGETDIKPAETSEKADAKPAQSQTSKPAVSEQKTKPAANTPENPIQNRYRARHQNLQLMNNRQSRYRNQVRQLHSPLPKHLLNLLQHRLQHLLQSLQNHRNLK